ncbi:hypothetical protein EV356DRAFT_364292 [Viridothelium virens]|uniref:Uncharacterized protein n=1 Tax=Viridothelium virens TaxID=1048519 RepID=A0A6A6GWH5_VIRVR|nr:hypothetical protein EV356DRAFT_364292 [Viridothelium virens]
MVNDPSIYVRLSFGAGRPRKAEHRVTENLVTRIFRREFFAVSIFSQRKVLKSAALRQFRLSACIDPGCAGQTPPPRVSLHRLTQVARRGKHPSCQTHALCITAALLVSLASPLISNCADLSPLGFAERWEPRAVDVPLDRSADSVKLWLGKLIASMSDRDGCHGILLLQAHCKYENGRTHLTPFGKCVPSH